MLVNPRIAETVATTLPPGYASDVNETEAKEACAQFAATHPDRRTHRWVPTKHGDEWVVAKIGLPPPTDDSTTERRADERPPTPDAPPNSEGFKNWVYGGLG